MNNTLILKADNLYPRIAEDRVWNLAVDYAKLGGFSGLKIVSAGLDERVAGNGWGEGLSSTHLIFFILHGTMEILECGSKVSGGQWVFINCNIHKKLAAPDGDMRGVWMHVKNESIWKRYSSSVIVQDTRHTPLIYSLMEAMIQESHGSSQTVTENMRLMSKLFSELIQNNCLGNENSGDRKLRQGFQLVWDQVAGQLEKDWTVTEMSRMAHISVGHFHREVQRLYGQSPSQILTRMRMEKASALLKTSSLCLTEIAKKAGYKSAYAFSNAFLKVIGVRPGAYRRPEP